ncbi:NUDIX hydrolase [Pseudogemmobacter sonorensis]|uniref:NUDIX hydrolase n=1 Tax=Pseudogemmobacter sonorensis TaxID=2989681 RepID=UPI003679F2AD
MSQRIATSRLPGIRRFGEPVKPGQSYRRRPGVYAVLLAGDHILTTFQEAPVPEFQLPGGGIDPGEHPISALHREVIEETGWKIAPRRRIGTFRRFTFMPEYDFWAEKICTIYLARPVMRLSAPTEAGHSAVWLPVEEALVRLGNAGDRALLAETLRQTGG